MPIKALGLYQNDWTIKVRLTKKGDKKTFHKKDGDSFLLPLEFIDLEGTQIAATMFGAGVEKYENALVPMNCYMISGGNVKVANKKFTSIKNAYSLTLDATSKIQEIPNDPSIPRTGYSLALVNEISSMPVGTMIDVLGVIISMSDITKITRKDGTEVDKKQVLMCDESGHSIDLNLWGIKATEEFKEGEIMIARCVKVGEFNGKNLSTVPDTSFFRNPEDERVLQLKNWISNNPNYQNVVALSSKETLEKDLSVF